MDTLKNVLPSGLVVWKIPNADERFMQRATYDIVTPTFECKRQITKLDEPVKKKAHVASLLQQLIHHVDDMYEAYPFNMKKATEKYMKDRLLEFVMSDHGNTVLGPKRCREVVSYMGTTMKTVCEAYLVLCSFLLDAKVLLEHKVYTWNHQSYTQEVVFTCKN